MTTRRSGNPLRAVAGKYVVAATVTETERLTPSMLRVRLSAERPIPFACEPGQHVRVEIRDPLSLRGILKPGETLRTYTVWDIDPDRRAIDVCVHLYDGDGIGLRWARSAQPGDGVRFWWPQPQLVLRDAPAHLFVGEETATVGFARLLAAVDPSSRVTALLESESPEHDVPVPGGDDVHRVHRRGASPIASRALLAALAELDVPPGVAYVAGEARTCQLVRDFLVSERGWPRRSISVKPFWAPGKRGLH